VTGDKPYCLRNLRSVAACRATSALYFRAETGAQDGLSTVGDKSFVHSEDCAHSGVYRFSGEALLWSQAINN
jgi:hypothetical protein